MSAFDAAFDAAFDSFSIVLGPPLETGVASFPGEISVVDPMVFDSTAGYLRWSASVIIGEVNVSGRLLGQLKISASEDSPRTATFSVIPATEAELIAYDSAQVTIDVTLFRTGQSAVFRRFTGKVESVEFNVSERIAEIGCRDGYIERPKACTTASEVEALFESLAVPCQQLLPWSTTEPDPVAYFDGLLATLPGAVCIDSSGGWRAVSWSFGAPSASFTVADIFDGSLKLARPNRADVPSSVAATLNHRYPRLHAAMCTLSWSNPENYTRLIVDGLPQATKSMVTSAVEGISGWLVKGAITLTEPEAGVHVQQINNVLVVYPMPKTVAETLCKGLLATMYRRWYQEVEVHYRIDIPMGGLSERDDAISMSISSTFDSSAWESERSSQSSSGLYQANPPPGYAVPTGYDGLTAPFPPDNGAVDHFADLDLADINQAASHVVARALRKAADGKRKQRVTFERPLDPRWEIGSVLAVSAYGLSATGQVADFSDSLDFDSGEAVSSFTLACPDGSGQTTGFTAGVTPPVNGVIHDLTVAPLGNYLGAASETPFGPYEDGLQGWLCNVQPSVNSPFPSLSTYDAVKPVYNPQFRILMPEIPANVRDPLDIDADITASVSIAGSGVTVVF